MAAIGGAEMCRAYGAGACGGPEHPGLPAWAKFCRASGAGECKIGTGVAAIAGAGMCRAYGARACGGHEHPGLPAWAKFCRASGADECKIGTGVAAIAGSRTVPRRRRLRGQTAAKMAALLGTRRWLEWRSQSGGWERQPG